MERGISVRLIEITGPVKVDLSKLVPNISLGPNQNGPYQPKFPEFWVKWKTPNIIITYYMEKSVLRGAKTLVESILPLFSGTWDAVFFLCIIYDWS